MTIAGTTYAGGWTDAGGGFYRQDHKGLDLRESVPVLADIWPGGTEKATVRVYFNETGVWYQQKSNNNIYQVFRPPDSSVNHRIQLCAGDNCASDEQWVTVATEGDDFQFANFNGHAIHYLTGLDLHKDWWVRIGYDAKVYNYDSDCTAYALGGGPRRSDPNKGWTPPCGADSGQGAGWTYSRPARVLRSPIAHPENEVIFEASLQAGKASGQDYIGFNDGHAGDLVCINDKDRWGRNDTYCHDNFWVGNGRDSTHSIDRIYDSKGTPNVAAMRFVEEINGTDYRRRLPLGIEDTARLKVNGKVHEFEGTWNTEHRRYGFKQDFDFANGTTYPFSIYIPVSEITTPADRLLDATITAESLIAGDPERGYNADSSPTVGSITNDDFIYNGKRYELTRLNVNTGTDEINLDFDPDLTATEANDLKIAIGDQVFRSGWTTQSGRLKRASGDLTFDAGDSVRIIIEDATGHLSPGDVPDAPLTLDTTVADGAVGLSWTARNDSNVTNWQWRARPDGGTWSNWGFNKGKATRTHSVNTLHANRVYTFEVRALSRSGSSEPSPQARAFVSKYITQMTAEVTDDDYHGFIASGFPHRDHAAGSLNQRGFYPQNIRYTINELSYKDDTLYLGISPLPSATVLGALELTIDGVEYTGSGWTCTTGSDWCTRDKGTELTLTKDEVVEVEITGLLPTAPARTTTRVVHETTITAKEAVGGTHFGYWANNMPSGSIGDDTFTYSGAEYMINQVYIDTTNVTFKAEPIIVWQDTIQNDLIITIKGKTYDGGWANGRQAKDGLSIVADETFTIKIEERVDTVFGFAVTSGDTSATLSWEGPSDPTTNLWQYRYKVGSGSWRDWTDIPGGGLVREHRVKGLTNDIAHTFQLRHFSASGGGESGEETVTPEWQYQPLHRHEFLTPDSGDGHRGYLKGSHSSSEDGTPEFYIDGTYYIVTEIRENGTDVFFDTEPQMDLDVLNELSIVVTDSGDTTRKTYYRGWTEESGKFKQPRQHQFNNDKEFVTITHAPKGLTATPVDTGMVLNWTGPDGGAVITKWQYRTEAGSTWGSWTDVPGDGTALRVRITGLDNGTSYGFQIRFVYTDEDGDSQNGVSSKEVTATAN